MHMKWWLPGLFIISAYSIFICLGVLAPLADGATQNMTEHSWIYNQGYSDDMRIYQTTSGFHGQKLVTGTRGTGTISRSIDAQAYGGFADGFNEIWANEWGVYQNKPSLYSEPITQNDLRNALCAKNYEVGSVYSESYSELRDLVKDTSVSQTTENSVYSIHTEADGTARVGARVQKGAGSAPAYVMTGSYKGYTNMRMQLESGNASIMTLPCP